MNLFVPKRQLQIKITIYR